MYVHEYVGYERQLVLVLYLYRLRHHNTCFQHRCLLAGTYFSCWLFCYFALFIYVFLSLLFSVSYLSACHISEIIWTNYANEFVALSFFVSYNGGNLAWKCTSFQLVRVARLLIRIICLRLKNLAIFWWKRFLFKFSETF